MRTVGDLFPARRDLLKIGGFGLLGASVDAVWPPVSYTHLTLPTNREV